MKALERLGRVWLSPNFFGRDMLYGEIANFHGIPNIPDEPNPAIMNVEFSWRQGHLSSGSERT